VLAKIHRMRRAEDFRRAVRRGRRVSGRTLVVHAISAQPDQPARVGFVVNKAVGNSVLRHRVQRRLRAAVRPHLPRLGSRMLVIRALPAAATVGYADLRSDLERCLSSVEGIAR
jgi:ribonuclease P protein component